MLVQIEEKELSWALECKTELQPFVWRPLTDWKASPAVVMADYTNAKQRPGVLEVRIVERVISTRCVDYEITPERLKERAAHVYGEVSER